MARKIITCSACGARFDVSKYPSGSRVRCGRCNQVLTVPIDEGPVDPAPLPSGTASRQFGNGPRAAAAPPASQRAGTSAAAPAAEAPQRAAPAPPVTQAPDADPLVGRVIHAQYRIVRKLGEGGYGAVYEAKDVNLERRVAIKIMLQARAQSREYVAKFLREARTAAQLSHPNVVAVHGVGFDRDLGVHFLAMEYVEGRTLHDILQERGPMPAAEACDFIIQSCRGLQAAHDRNIIHRDIKPGNLMLTPGGVIKITDFGLAKIYDEAAAQSTVIGTPYFMPPEQFEGKAKDGRTDIYALGVTFYYMLTMQRPHTGAGPAQILLSVMTKEPASIVDHRSDLPEGLWPIVRRMIHRDVDKRYATCSEICADLERLQGGGEEEVEQLYCPSCGVPNALDASACTGCGESLQETCPVCSAVDAAGTKFCGDCGANIPLERAVLALAEEAQAILQTGKLDRAREKLLSAQERSPQNVRVTQLLRDLDIRRENRDGHRDAIRDLLAQGHPDEALDRWRLARAEFPESPEIGELEGDIRSARAARESTGSASVDAVTGARVLEESSRIREALVAWRGVLVLQPGNDDALQGERRCRERVERADSFAADAAEFLREGDPETAHERLVEAGELLPNDPVVGGKLRETERILAELEAELAATDAVLAKGASEPAVERLRILAARYPGSRRVRTALDAAEHAGRAASQGAARDRLQRALATAKRHDASRHLRDAAASWREVLQIQPDSPEAEAGLARALRGVAESEALLAQSRSLLASGDPEGAAAAAEHAMALVAEDPAAAAQLARARTSLETMQHEAQRIRAALSSDPDDDVLSWARELATRFPASPLASDVLRETERATREAEEKAGESRAQTLLARAAKLEEQKQYERAAGAYEEAVKVAPGNAAAKKALDAIRDRLSTAALRTDEAQAKLDAGDPEAAKSLAEAALALLPDVVRATGVLAAARTGIAEIERAFETLDSSTGIAPERADAQVERVRRLRTKYAGSKRCADLEARALKVADDARTAARRERIAARIAAAEGAIGEGRLADADREIREAAAIEPDDALVKGLVAKVAARRARSTELVGAAREHASAGRLAQALAAFEEALSHDPQNADARTARDAVAADIERAREAVRKAQGEAVQADRAGKPRDALAAWERVAQLEPNNSKAITEIARLRAWAQKAAEALVRVRDRLAAGDPEQALVAAQEARTRLGAWDEVEELLRRSRALVDEIDRGSRKIERDLTAGEGDLSAVAEAAAALAAKFQGSNRAREVAARANSVAEERRRSAAVSQVRKLVREHRYAEAVALAAELRGQGVASTELDGAESQARKVLADVERLRGDAVAARARGDLDAARAALANIQTILPDDAAARDAVHELDETVREFAAHLDAAETARRRGELTRAIDTYREALGINPGSAVVRERMDDVGAQQGRRTELVRTCERAIRGGDGDACARVAKDLLGLFPDDEDARALHTTGESLRNLVGSLLVHAKRQHELGERDSARVTLECLLRVAPEHAEARTLLAT